VNLLAALRLRAMSCIAVVACLAGACASSGSNAGSVRVSKDAKPAGAGQGTAADSVAPPASDTIASPPATSAPSPAPSASDAASKAAAYRIYVGTESADAVAVVEAPSWKVVKQIPVGISLEDIEGVHGLAIAPDGKHWYITLAHGFPYGSLWKFTVGRDSLVGRAELGNFPATIGITPDGAWGFVVNYNLHGDKTIDTVSAVYIPTMTEVTQIRACVKPHGLDVSQNGAFVIVTCTRDDTILKIDVGTLRESARGSVRLPEEEAAGKDCYATGVQVMPDGSRAYVSCGHANEVRVVDLATMRVKERIAECKGAYLLQLDPEARRLWVPCRSGQDFVVIDTQTNKIVGRIPTTREFPHTAAFSPDGAYALLTQESKGVIPGAMDVVERGSLKKVMSVDVGLQATGIGVVSAD
jgi:DNA-binding beta-propeller fold protein YncE